MNKIQKLDKHLMNMIAAGEVVERPAGIVKELVENAIDAHASVVEVNFKNGGIDLISVTDNGDGMSRDDALLSFERHATSKIKEESDLWSINTLGFRGEAIPSIASVSKVELITNNDDESNRIVVEYGEMTVNEPIASNKGTKISIEGLFHRTPARLKSFKSVNYERAIIISTMEKFAFSYPQISFILTDDHKEIIHTSGNDNLIEIMYHVYGKEVARQSFTFENENSDFKISGILVQPAETRANRNHIQIFINDRMVRSYRLSSDVIAGYKHLMFNDRFPIAIVKLEMDHQLVDVNVHPSKWEVRIAKEKLLSEFITETIKTALQDNMEIVQVKTQRTQRIDSYEQIQLETDERHISKKAPVYEQVVHERIQPTIHRNVVASEAQTTVEEVIDEPLIIKDPTPVSEMYHEDFVYDVKQVIVDNEFSKLRVIGQLHGKYILAESEDSLYIIDQHAAEERTNFEKIKNQIKSNVIESTPLLIPVIVQIKQSETHYMEALIDALSSVGLHIESFSETSVVIREVPLWLLNQDQQKFVLDVLEYIVSHKDVSLESLRYDVIATKACKASIKFNHSLSMAEMQQLVINLSKCENPHHCPHGRPTLIKMTEAQLIKEFMR